MRSRGHRIHWEKLQAAHRHLRTYQQSRTQHPIPPLQHPEAKASDSAKRPVAFSEGQALE